MLRRFVVLSFSTFLSFLFGSTSFASPTGELAYQYTSQILEFGPRPPGSKGIEKVRKWIEGKVGGLGFKLETDSFIGNTPMGDIGMQNLSFQIPGTSPKEIVLVAHYDSKLFDKFTFVGANDAASSVALLLALTPEIQKLKLTFPVRVLFVDGEEALRTWSDSDSLYGSRRFVSHHSAIDFRAAIVVDMIGDKDLKLIRNIESNPALLKLVPEDLLEKSPIQVEDDHTPFVYAGIPTLHLMDFTYPPWHKAEDTLDKISAKSLATVAQVILEVLPKIH